MAIAWPTYFRKERAIRHCAERAGIAKPRARALAEQLASRRLPKMQRAQLVVAIAQKRLSGKKS